MSFRLELRELGKENMLETPDYISPPLSNERVLLSVLRRMIEENKRVLLYGDYDPDGALCVQVIIEAFKTLGFTNYEVFKYSSRTHSIDSAAVNKAITGRFDFMIICDAGSQEPQVIRRLNDMGVETILIDHHMTPYDYSDFAGHVVNTTIENRTNDEDLILSAGALTFVIFDKLLKYLGKKNKSLAALGLASMYADSVDMSSELARGIYYEAMELGSGQLPKVIQHMMGPYSTFNRRFIEFQFTPRLNSLFRSENFKLLNKYLYWDPSSGESLVDIVEEITEAHSFAREEVAKASDLLVREELTHFVIGDLSSVAGMVKIPQEQLHNYTGRVANKLAEMYNKTSIVFADSGSNIKASLRDQQGRNYLELFQQFCRAGGHNSAFGINMDYIEFNNFIDYIKLIDKDFFINTVGNTPIVVNHSVANPDPRLLADMAQYNEFSGVKSPIALIQKVWLEPGVKPQISKYGGKYYKWGPAHTVSTKNTLMPGSVLHIKPYKAKGIKLEVADILN